MDEPNRSFEDDLKIITAILTAGYLRYRERRRRELSLDSAEASSPHGHEVTALRKENDLSTDVSKQIEELAQMTVSQLREKYIEVFGEESRSNHKQFVPAHRLAHPGPR